MARPEGISPKHDLEEGRNPGRDAYLEPNPVREPSDNQVLAEKPEAPVKSNNQYSIEGVEFPNKGIDDISAMKKPPEIEEESEIGVVIFRSEPLDSVDREDDPVTPDN